MVISVHALRIRWYLYFPLLILGACSDKPGKHQVDKIIKDHTVNAQGKPPSSFSDTIKVGFPSAVFYGPDSLQLEKIKASTDPRIFESLTHENFYMMRNARQVILKYYPATKIVDVNNYRFILFEKRGFDKIIIDLNTKDPFGLFIFDGKKDPMLTDMANIDTDLGFYFDKTNNNKGPAK
ncbi:hypothetical protein [Flavihumibacter profundi]|uniref:hypothetical protein n=1 Tax=Flavihumibacter profundi TaxID=2716883 RepID=UPI001CC82A3D|nr:hypothetical protein [Flavihumibacter profundi]MBZ5858834.1 hypothetical protein [Flavihumibacter profundi]